MNDDMRQELVDRVMSFVWAKGVQATPVQIIWPMPNLQIAWDPTLKSLRFSVRVERPHPGVAFSDVTILKITFGGGRVWRRDDLQLKALLQLRQLMILDDLADV